MFTRLFLVAGILFAIILGNHAFGDVLSVPIKKVFIPSGFDDNDNVEVVVHGYLPSLCYRVPQAMAEIEGDKIYVRVAALASPHTECLDIKVPFSLNLSLGQLRANDYEVLFEYNLVEQRQKFRVWEAPVDTEDTFFYANVEKVFVSKNQKIIKVAYRSLSSCLQFDRLSTLNNGTDVISLLPILEHNRAENCTPRNSEEFVTWQVPEKWQGKTVLVHIRSMNGISHNAILHSPAPFPTY